MNRKPDLYSVLKVSNMLEQWRPLPPLFSRTKRENNKLADTQTVTRMKQ